MLVSKALPGLQKFRSQKLGYFCGPRNTGNLSKVVRAGLLYACDNDCFNGGLDAPAYREMCKRAAQNRSGCLFVTVPDVVADAEKTLEMFDQWEPELHSLGLPVALVGQDGLENLEVPWDRCEAFFVGGSTEWKEGSAARELVSEARERGKWVHMGRVNKPPRVKYAHSIGVDSIDGTQHSWYADTHIPITLSLLELLGDAPKKRRRTDSQSTLWVSA